MAYTKVDVSEQRLEGLVQRNPEMIEEGLLYVDHQRSAAGGRLDILMVDSGRSLIVAELKIVQDDGMLMQGLDYYDYVSTNVEALARLYKAHLIDPTQAVRLFLIAPDFSEALVNRCKWLDLPVSLFTFVCLKLEDQDEIIPVFMEREFTPKPVVVKVPQFDDHLAYITDELVRSKALSLIEEIKSWKPGSIFLDPIKDAISMKVNNRVFAYLYPRRKHYVVGTWDAEGQWKDLPVKTDDDLTNVKSIVKSAMGSRAN